MDRGVSWTAPLTLNALPGLAQREQLAAMDVETDLEKALKAVSLRTFTPPMLNARGRPTRELQGQGGRIYGDKHGPYL